MILSDKKITLSPRLQMIADMVPKGSIVADIGTDHGYIPIYLIQTGSCPAAFASDVRRSPIERAKSNVEKYRLENKISLLVADGIDDEKMKSCDAFVIAGMGGELIREIIKRSSLAKAEGTVLILQPMSGEEELREFLSAQDYFIMDERLCREGDKLYLAIAAKYQKTKAMPKIFTFVGKELVERQDPLLTAYIDKKIAAKQKERQGLLRSKDPQKEQKIQKLEQLIAELSSLRTKGEDS